MTVLGEVELDQDGILHGWCWCPERPEERLTVDLLIDDVVVTSLVASRFREDVRHRKFGDGYHGFTVALTRHIQALSGNVLIAARERVSGEVFWHLMYGEFVMPEDFDGRMGSLRERLGRLGRRPGLRPGAGKADADIAGAFGMMGARLGRRPGAAVARARARPFPYPAFAAPAASVILTPRGEAPSCIEALRRAGPGLAAAAVEVILCDDGIDPRTLALPNEVEGLKFIAAPAAGLAERRNLAVQITRSPKLLFLESAGHGLAAAIKLLADERLVAADWIARDAARLSPAVLVEPALAGSAPDGFVAAISRAALLALGGFDESMDDGDGLDIIDLVMRAAQTGMPVRPWRLTKSRTAAPREPTAGKHFAARWLAGRP